MLGGAFQGSQLLPEGDVFNDQFMMSAARQGERSDEKEQHLQHAPILFCDGTKIHWHLSGDGVLARDALSSQFAPRVSLQLGEHAVSANGLLGAEAFGCRALVLLPHPIPTNEPLACLPRRTPLTRTN